MRHEVMITENELKERIATLAQEINRDYKGKKIVVVGVLTGAYMFCADLLRAMTVEVESLEFISISSYGDSMTSSGNVRLFLDLKRDIAGKHVLIIEDIVDTGLTIHSLMELFERRHPSSIRLAALLDKPSRRKHEVKVDYTGFLIEDKFVYGYGLDLFGACRELPFIAIYSGDAHKELV